MAQRPALLKNSQKPQEFEIQITLRGPHTARLIFSDRSMAWNQYVQLRGLGIYMGTFITDIKFQEL